MTRARRNIYDGYCPICGKSGCDGSCIWPIPRLAAGPIPVPEGLAERVYQAVCEFIHTYWGRTSEPLGDRSTRIVLTTKGTKVHGQPVPVIHVIPTSEKVLRPHGPLLGAFTYLDRPIPEIVVQFNGSKTGVEIDEAMRGLPGFKVQGWLHHELAHVFDKIPKGVGSDPWEDSKVYYNDPVEVRAYSSQVWRYVMDNRDYYAASEGWIQKTGEKGLWELVDSAVTGYVGAKIRNLCTEKNRRYILQTAYHALQEAVRPSKVAADESGLKADLMRVRPILRAWTAGGWTDGPQLLKLLEKHKDILAKFRPTSPLRLWRNERIEGPDGGPGSGALNNHGWEDQYTRPTAWSARRTDAETYAAGKGRRLVTAIVPPEDMYVSIPMVDHAAKGLGMKPFDPYAQSEVIVRPNPSFLDQLRPPVKYTREEEAKIREQLVEQLRVYYAPQVKKLQEQHPEGAQGIAQRAEEQIQGMVSSIHTEELPEKVKEWTATIQQWEKTASVVLRASKTLYHGTTRDKAQEILKYGLAPDVGSLTTRAYGDEDADLQPLTFAADREGLGGGVFSALLHAIGAEGHPTTDEIQAIRNWGAVVVIKEGEDTYQHRPGLDEKGSEDDYVDYPTQVESGDYYSEDSVDADYAITGPALVRWLTRNGVNLHQGYADPITRSERNRLIGWVHRVHPSIPMQEIIEKVTSLPSREFRESWIYYKKALSKAASMPTITTQAAHDRGMFGPVFHGTTEDTFSKIQDEGFKLIEGQRGDEGVSNGYASGDYSNGIPAPAHHLGFGIYFTTVKNIAKYFAGGSTKTLKPYYLDVHNVETINFGSPNTMMKWWIANGYDPELAKKDRMAATKQLTETLRSKHDAVWFKGKGLHALLDKDQIVVFDPSKVYVLDDSKAEPGSLRSKVQRKSDGMVGVLLDKRPLPPGMYDKMMAARETLPEDQRNSHWFILTPETKYTLTVKWQKGGTDYNVYDTEVVPYQGKRTRAAMALLGDVPAAPGTTSIKPGYVRLYHQTGEANLQSIEKTGLRLDHAKGTEGPRAIYAGEEPFYGDPESIPTLEFQVPKDKWQPPFVLQDVMPEDFIAAHYPWHRTVRYLEGEPESMQAALAGQHDGLGGDEGKAIAYVKQKYGKTASIRRQRTRLTASSFTAYHASDTPGIQTFHPLTHFGSRRAAEDRKASGKLSGKPVTLYQVRLTMDHPLRLPDLKSSKIRPSTHSWLRLTDMLYYDVKPPLLSDAERSSILRASSPEALIHVLEQKGFDGIVYTNRFEDPGSDSWIIFHPEQAHVLQHDVTAKSHAQKEVQRTGKTSEQLLNETVGRKNMELDSQGLDLIRRERSEIRLEETGVDEPSSGQCGEMAEIINARFGLKMDAGFYLKDGPSTSHTHSDHVWNLLPDGSIFDATHDQFGSPDILTAHPGSPEAARYHSFCKDPYCPHCTCETCNPDWAREMAEKRRELERIKQASKSHPSADRETEAIRERSKTPEAQKPHKFQPAKWTLPNGHPRCLICGDEEMEGGMCSGVSKTASSFTLRQTPSREDSQNPSQTVKSSASKQPDSVYFHGRSQDRPYHGRYIFLTPSRDYALGYSKGPDGMHAFKIKVPMSSIFTMKHPEKLRAALSPEAWGSIEAAIQPGEEMDWASISSVCNEEHEEAEDLFQALGYRGTWLKERNGINSIYLFDQGDAEEVPLPTKTAELFQRQSGRSIMHGWLLPDGTFKDAAEGKLGEHWETALQEFSPDVQRPAKDPDIMGAMRKAFDAGWIRVSMQGLDALKWTDDMLHRAQAFLQQQGVLPRLRYFYVESQMPMWTAKVEPATDLLTLNKVSDLWRYRGSKTAAGTPTLRVSNPGGDWLKENQEACREGGKDRFGCPKVWGPVTASFSSDVLVRVDILKGIRGMRGEQNNVRPDTISWMTENMGQSGRLPQVNDQDYTPFIMVDCEGHPWVSEGNHRIMTAAKLGWKWLPIELRYFSGGEQARFGLLNPRFVINQHQEAERLGYNMGNYALKDPLDVKNQKQPTEEP